VTDSNYIEQLLKLCIRQQVGLVVPTIDTELLVLSSNIDLFAASGIVLAVSDFSFVSRCRDKRKTNDLFAELEIETPRFVDKHNPTFPLFIKPYDGSLSRDILLIQSASDWRESLLENEKLMFMEYLNPRDYQEFTIDAYFNKEGILKCLVPRRRIEVRGGEISKGSTEKGVLYKTLKKKFAKIPGARSCITMQFFEHKVSGRIVGIEINPRFGGGYPLSYAAHARFPAFMIEEYLIGKEISFYEEWINKIIMLRYDAEVILDERDFS
jgi:carbamoyl-phosphate synthase large subunit